VLIGAVWIGIGSIVLFVLAQSRRLGSRPTMGRRERLTNECSFRADFLQSAAHARNLHGSLRPLNPPIQSSFDSLCSINPGRKRPRGEFGRLPNIEPGSTPARPWDAPIGGLCRRIGWQLSVPHTLLSFDPDRAGQWAAARPEPSRRQRH
jgi:hypothetical protein